MSLIESRRTPEELIKLSNEIYDRRIRPIFRPEDENKFIAIDVDSGDYEIDQDDDSAVSNLKAWKPSSDIWLGHIGQPAAYRMGRSE